MWTRLPRVNQEHIHLWRILGINVALLVVLGRLFLAGQWFDVRATGDATPRSARYATAQFRLNSSWRMSPPRDDGARACVALGDTKAVERLARECVGRHPALVSLTMVPFADYRGSSLNQIGVGRSCKWQLSAGRGATLARREAICCSVRHCLWVRTARLAFLSPYAARGQGVVADRVPGFL